MGDIATFSLYGNKIVTTGEGGMVVTRDESLARRVRRLRGQGVDPNRRYWFVEVEFNYRMTNIAAAIGLAQLENVGWHLERRHDDVMSHFQGNGIETRPIFHPVHTLPPYRDASRGSYFPVAERIAERGISLPTWAGLMREDVEYVCGTLLEYLSMTRELERHG